MNVIYEEVSKKIENLAIIPVIKIEDSNKAKDLAQSLLNGGLLVAEVTFRTNAAAKSISTIRKEFPQMLTGAGTVLTIDQVNASMDSGAQFIVSPGFNPKVVDYCIGRGIPVYPGVNNPSGIEMALERGLNRLKFFPAEASGGIKMVNAMAAPYGEIKFMATGGINKNNLISYLESPYICACGGSWMVKADLIEKREYKKIEELTKEALQLIKEWRRK